jgi:hypothetical protein
MAAALQGGEVIASKLSLVQVGNGGRGHGRLRAAGRRSANGSPRLRQSEKGWLNNYMALIRKQTPEERAASVALGDQQRAAAAAQNEQEKRERRSDKNSSAADKNRNAVRPANDRRLNAGSANAARS